MFFLHPPQVRELAHFTSLPARFRTRTSSAWL